jgi:RhtB (resistance to homoserine/threonine) family protein
MDDSWNEFSKVAAAHLLAVISPGPDFALVLRQSLGYGRRVAIWTSIGIGTAILLHVSYSLLGIGLLIQSSATWFTALKFAGAAYIAWLGFQALRAKPAKLDEGSSAGSSISLKWTHAFIAGFFTNALNPKATLFFIALFATVIDGHTPRLVQAGYGLWMSLATMAWFCLVSVLFTRGDVRVRFVRHGHWVSRILGILLIGFAVSLAVTRWQ